jgi:hypothetical protein
MHLRHWILICLFLFPVCATAAAEEIVLRVEGPGDAPPIALTEAKIRTLPAETFSTLDPWDKKKRTYTGVSILDLLKKIDRLDAAQLVEVEAKNDYKAKFTVADLRKYKPILSYEMDGKDYSTFGEDDKGPLAVAIKMENVSPADQVVAKNGLVWWVETIVLH